MNNTLFWRVGALVAFSLNLTLINAQTVQIGVSGSFNQSKIIFKDAELPPGSGLYISVTPGYRFAIPVELGFGKYFALQPELAYSRQGTDYSLSIYEYTGSYSYQYNEISKLNYSSVEIPLLLKFKLGTPLFKASLQAGPYFSLGLSGERYVYASEFTRYSSGFELFNEYEGTYPLQFLSDGYREEDLEGQADAFSRFSYGLQFGTSGSFHFGRIALFLEIRYLLGLSDLHPELQNEPDNTNAQLRSTSLGLGIMMKLGG